MTEEPRKRLEKAANEYARYIDRDYRLATFIAFQRGAEWMYKEATRIVDELLVEIANEYFGDFEQSIELAEKVTERVNKIWEEGK